MTRAQRPTSHIEYRTIGTPSSPRRVVILRTGAIALTDPDPNITADFDVQLVLVKLQPQELEDPPAFGGQTPAEETTAALSELITRIAPQGAVGLVGERTAAPLAVELAVQLGERLAHLVLVAPAVSDSGLERDRHQKMLAQIAAPALVVSAPEDEVAPPSSGEWFRQHLSDAQIVEVPIDPESTDHRLGVTDVWRRVLDFAAPGKS